MKDDNMPDDIERREFDRLLDRRTKLARAEFDKKRFAELFSKYKEDPVELLKRQYYEGTSLVLLEELLDSTSSHEFAKKILSPLHESVGLDYICVSLGLFQQPDIDEYCATGDEQYLNKVIDREKKRIERGKRFYAELYGEDSNLPNRVEKGYFECLKEAQGLGILIVSTEMDNRDIENPKFLKGSIPEEGKGIIYCPLGDLIHYKRDSSKDHFTTQVDSKYILTVDGELFSKSLLPLEFASTVAVDLKKHQDIMNLMKNNFIMRFFEFYNSIVFHP